MSLTRDQMAIVVAIRRELTAAGKALIPHIQELEREFGPAASKAILQFFEAFNRRMGDGLDSAVDKFKRGQA